MPPLWLKSVPWSTILSNAPLIVDGAKKLVSLVKQRGSEPGSGLSTAADSPQQLADRVTQLEQHQQEGAELLRSLAETNAQLAHEIEVLRRRVAINSKLVIAASICTLGIVVWLLMR
jgi:hypothetical protein